MPENPTLINGDRQGGWSAHAAVEFMRELGAETIEHPGGTLLAHLRRVHDLLGRWGAAPDLRLAGLCHAFYGTDGFATALLPLGRRGELADIIGADAEALVYFYASCDRASSYAQLAHDDGLFRDRFTGEALLPPTRQRRAFAELTAANELHIAHVSPAVRAQAGAGLRALFTRWDALLSDGARAYCQAVLG